MENISEAVDKEFNAFERHILLSAVSLRSILKCLREVHANRSSGSILKFYKKIAVRSILTMSRMNTLTSGALFHKIPSESLVLKLSLSQRTESERLSLEERREIQKP